MGTYQCKTAVAIVVFNRPDLVRDLLSSLREAQVSKLYVISDAPREGKDGETDLVAQVRECIDRDIDWPCEVHKLYQEKNLGCDRNSVVGYNWVFQHESEAILIEDDAAPVQAFFRFCDDMLEYYREDERVMMVSGMNPYPQYSDGKDYYFSFFPAKYAWATWRRAWEKYDDKLENYDSFNENHLFEIMDQGLAGWYRHTFASCRAGWTAWDAKWDFARIYHNGLGIVPAKNLVVNKGVNRADATHANEDSLIAHLSRDPEFYVEEFRREAIWDKEYDLESEKNREDLKPFVFDKKVYRRAKIYIFCRRWLPSGLFKALIKAKHFFEGMIR